METKHAQVCPRCGSANCNDPDSKSCSDNCIVADRKTITELLEALNAWMLFYEGHSTPANRERAYNLTRAAIAKATHAKS